MSMRVTQYDILLAKICLSRHLVAMFGALPVWIEAVFHPTWIEAVSCAIEKEYLSSLELVYGWCVGALVEAQRL